jgi:hypothetical protein
MTEPLTLWKMLRKHGVGLYAAQMICNDVMLNGVSLPAQGEGQEPSNDLPGHDETIAGLKSLTIRK